ncbi:MAG: hypothetical protein C0624_09960 [Desulfuromonas sp.]|nr:MAG: hypothetical protein C0624_09960 [Desulfuromonas sp.]
MDSESSSPNREEGVEIPYTDLKRETLLRLIEEFVSRDGADWNETGGSLEAKVSQVLTQLKNGKIKIVFDLASQSANLVEHK